MLKHLEHSSLTSRKLKNHFLTCFTRQTFASNNFKSFPLLSQETVSTSSFKNLLEFEKCYFRKLKTLAFDLKVASQLFFKILPMTNFCFDQLSKHCLDFPENCHTKFAKMCKSCVETFVFHLKVASKPISKLFYQVKF